MLSTIHIFYAFFVQSLLVICLPCLDEHQPHVFHAWHAQPTKWSQRTSRLLPFYRVVDVLFRGRQNAARVRATGKAAQKFLSPPKIPDEFLGLCASASAEAVMPMVPERRFVDSVLCCPSVSGCSGKTEKLAGLPCANCYAGGTSC